MIERYHIGDTEVRVGSMASRLPIGPRPNPRRRAARRILALLVLAAAAAMLIGGLR